jgi:putative methionine-R-sulfoxide reductase with GAF domain
MNLADRFAMLWEADAPPPDVFAFLKTCADIPPRDCADILLIDQHHRWQTGDALPVEAYFREFPAVASDPELKLDLVFSELRNTARVSGNNPDIDQFVNRFPDLKDDLIRQFEVAEWLEAGVNATLQEVETKSSADRDVALLLRASESPLFPMNLEVLERLGEGAMGVVHRARQATLNRVVAFKIIHAGARSDSKQLNRFLTEVQAVARLSHPNFVQIYEIGVWKGGEWDDLPYFVMEHVNGGSLARKLSSGPLPIRQAAQMVETLACAMSVAHEHGIVHRDLKPANILLTLDGQPKITDFGLAKISSGQDPGQSRSGAVVGTPSYMAPEQARDGDSSPTSDIYSLGATLYEMLTGRPPFRAATVYGTLVQVMNQEPVPPGRLRPKLPRDLETICLKCLEKKPQRRYPSANALAEDLHAFLSGEPIQAHGSRSRELALRWVRRKPAKAALLGVAGLTSIGLLLGTWWSNTLVVSSVAILCLIAGGSWYHARLLSVLREMTRQQIVMERYAERLQMLGEMSRQLMAVTNLDQLLYLIGETASRLANAELATIYLIDRNRGEVWSKVKLGNDIGEIRVPLGMGIAGTVAANGQMINLPDPYADARFNTEIDRQTGYKTRNLLTLPMIARSGEVIGVFQILNKRRGTFEAEDEEVLSSLAATAAVIIERARAHR